MRALSLDLSSETGSATVATRDTVLASVSLDVGNQPLRECSRLVSSVLNLAETQITEIDILSSVTGPGSWTGLRVAAVTVNTMATALRKPVVGVTVFESLSKLIQEPNSTIGVVQVSATQAWVAELTSEERGDSRTEVRIVGLGTLPSLIGARRAIVSMRPVSLTSLRTNVRPGAIVDIHEMTPLSAISAKAAFHAFDARPDEFHEAIVPFYAGSPVSEAVQDGLDKETGGPETCSSLR